MPNIRPEQFFKIFFSIGFTSLKYFDFTKRFFDLTKVQKNEKAQTNVKFVSNAKFVVMPKKGLLLYSLVNDSQNKNQGLKNGCTLE